MNTYWAKPPVPRHQLVLLAPSLDDMIAPGDPIRQLDAIFDSLDWSEYERAYDGAHGQPPIHPRYVAAALFYGIMRGLRTGRRVEEATRKHIDFMWLLQGQTLDHATVCKFRTRFKDALKGTFRQINQQGLERLGEAMVELVIDGTRLRANSDRHGARTAAWMEARLAQLQAHVEQALQDMAAEDLKDDPSSASSDQIRERLAELLREKEKYEAALEVARQRDEVKREKDGKNATPVRVPITDPSSLLLPNKEGGYAPNHTPVALVDTASGMIVAATVLPDGSEPAAVQPLLAEVQKELGTKPQRLLADSGFASGANHAALEEQGIALYAPVSAPVPEAHPARREDPSQPLSPDRIASLPRVGSNGTFDRNAFLFDPQKEGYWCPMGRPLPVRRVSRHPLDGTVLLTEYQSHDCTLCPLAGNCLSRKATKRTVTRDPYENARENTARRMAGDEAKAIYRRRAPTIEGTFGTIKGNMGIRAFLLRGLDKVRVEWLWICTAFNLKKLLKLLAAAAPAGGQGVAGHAGSVRRGNGAGEHVHGLLVLSLAIRRSAGFATVEACLAA